MSALLADELGYVQLAEPVRFRAGWEQAASLRLRAGDVSVLAEYDQHGRILGGEPERMMDAAAAAYVALTIERDRSGRSPRPLARAKGPASCLRAPIARFHTRAQAHGPPLPGI